MLIAIDYDETYTVDPALWDEFIKNAIDRGHKVIVATMRTTGEAANLSFHLGGGVEIYPTSRKAKKPFLAIRGIHPDIWIDDSPGWIFNDALPVEGLPRRKPAMCGYTGPEEEDVS